MTASAWRQERRKELAQLREGISLADRALLDAAIMRHLDSIMADRSTSCIAVYWPLPGEPDLRDWYQKIAASGARVALPAVVERQQALEFRRWDLAQPLVRDTLNIPCPGPAEPVIPDTIVASCLGFDPQGFRLGSGGGYYDRTLAGLEKPPLMIAVAYEQQRLHSIRPESHDIPADFIVTDKRVYSRQQKSVEKEPGPVAS
ncbi:MAG: 5-formyltetrahydrofolate cyclo-ligase [Woeseia sp.]|nr:5-formyltetrahydrofolate cyclo-ligase [Woeseia sp.]MBT8097583.1 5-formyltetrahydrofolate cyclo-ligase [Woeseia sp.]NNE61416.1 5-formyltetrahydrofolate cyclo-ligase [Woeseia sp.]NNL53898.1 5-formyltetrahydrofolate cyclo-ligase [Woeseia sp.]